MSAFTNFLNLFKWQPHIDGNEEFDIDKSLNENWDKIDNKMLEINKKGVAVSPTQPTTNESVWIKKGKNKFNKNTAPTIDVFVEIATNKFMGWYPAIRSTYIEIEPNTTYTISKQAGKTFRVATSADIPEHTGSIISTVADHTGTEITITTEANAKYLFLNYYNADNGDTAGEDVIRNSIQIEQNSTATDFEEFIEEKILIKNSAGVFEEYSDVVVSPVKPAQGKVWIKTGKNRFNRNAISSGCYLDSAGTLTTATVWVVSDFMDVEPNKPFSYRGLAATGTAPHSAFYDKNKGFISSFKQATGNNTITTPANAYYVRFSMYYDGEDSSNLDNFQFEQGSIVTAYEPYTDKEIYVKNENGVFERFYKEKEQNYCIARIGTDYSIQKQYEQENPKGYVGNSATAQLTISDNGIVVGKGVSKVKVSGQLRLNNLSTGDIVFGYISKNNNFPVACSNCSAGDRITFALTETIINVVEGDLIALKIQNNTTARGVVPASTDTTIYSFIKVEVVD